jgi:ATP-dependent RNA helicase DeaD
MQNDHPFSADSTDTDPVEPNTIPQVQINDAATESPVEPVNDNVEVVESIGETYDPFAATQFSSFDAFATCTVETTPQPSDGWLAEYSNPAVAEAVVVECSSAPVTQDESILCQHAAPVDSPAAAVEPTSEPIADNAPIAATAEPIKEEPKAPAIPDDPTFLDLPLSKYVQESVAKAGYEKPTPIQAQIIPEMLAGRDILAQSQTGTGKTAAFALPILTNIKTGQRKPQVLVLAPTRELAIQVAKSFSTYGATVPRFSVAAIYGGQDYEPQLKQLRRGVEVVVGTPGRVIDHIKRGTLDLSCIDCFVLDEADEMLNMGFLDDVEFVLNEAPEHRQVALFSATLPEPIRRISERYLNDPAKITIKKKTMTADSIRQRALYVHPGDKIDVLTRILESEETDGVIVFTKTKDATVTVAERLNALGLSAIALNGDMPQKVRERAIDQLKSGHLDILVATDVAARGLDVTRVSHVFNYDMPHDGESYIHRVGRTGRAGRPGEAIIFLTNAQKGKLRLIERVTNQPIQVVQPPTADDINAMRIKRFKQSITETTVNPDLTIFKKMIAEHAEESGQPMELIAAALAHLAQQGRSFLMADRPRRKQFDRDQGRNDRDYSRDNGRNNRDGRSSRYGNERSERGGKFQRNGGKSQGRVLGHPEEGMERYRIEVGSKDGVKPGNIVGAVANEGGLSGENIGPIKINDAYSTVDLPKNLSNAVCEKLSQTWVSGKQLKLALATGNDSQTESRSDNSRSDNRSRYGNKPRQGAGSRPSHGSQSHAHKSSQSDKPRPRVNGENVDANGEKPDRPFQARKRKKRKTNA